MVWSKQLIRYKIKHLEKAEEHANKLPDEDVGEIRLAIYELRSSFTDLLHLRQDLEQLKNEYELTKHAIRDIKRAIRSMKSLLNKTKDKTHREKLRRDLYALRHELDREETSLPIIAGKIENSTSRRLDMQKTREYQEDKLVDAFDEAVPKLSRRLYLLSEAAVKHHDSKAKNEKEHIKRYYKKMRRRLYWARVLGQARTLSISEAEHPRHYMPKHHKPTHTHTPTYYHEHTHQTHSKTAHKEKKALHKKLSDKLLNKHLDKEPPKFEIPKEAKEHKIMHHFGPEHHKHKNKHSPAV